MLLDFEPSEVRRREVLCSIRTNLPTKDLVVLVVTSSALSQDRDEELMALGFDGYF